MIYPKFVQFFMHCTKCYFKNKKKRQKQSVKSTHTGKYLIKGEMIEILAFNTLNSKVIDTYSLIIFSLLGFFMKLLWSRYPTFLTYNEQANKRRRKNASIYWNINLESTKLLNCHSSPHLLRSVLSYSNSLLPCKWVYTVHNRTASNFMLIYIFL